MIVLPLPREKRCSTIPPYFKWVVSIFRDPGAAFHMWPNQGIPAIGTPYCVPKVRGGRAPNNCPWRNVWRQGREGGREGGRGRGRGTTNIRKGYISPLTLHCAA